VTRLIVIPALAAALTGVASVAGSPHARVVDERLCPFRLGLTVEAKAITLRNLATGHSVTLARSPRRIWLAHGVPFLSTVGAAGHPRVIDPCALVAPAAPSTKPRETPAPWPAPAFTLSQIAYAGLIPVKGPLIRHDHVHLDVIVDGRRIIVPAGIGEVEPVDRGPGPCPPPPENRAIGDCAPGHFFTANVTLSPLHPHSASGIVHIESDRAAAFTLGQFFDEWRVRLTARCLGGYCSSGGGKELRIFVDGKRVGGDPRGLVLRDRQEIAVVFGGPRAFGSVPSSYAKRWPVGCGGPGEPACIS
jgi:hypothetical protein